MVNERLVSVITALLLAYFVVSLYFLYVSNSTSRQTTRKHNANRRLRASSKRPKIQEPPEVAADDEDYRNVARAGAFQLPANISRTLVYSSQPQQQQQQQQQKWRLKRVSDTCGNQSVERWPADKIKAASKNGFSLLVDDRLRYIYCRVAKVASTTWTRVLLVATGKVKASNPNMLSQSETYAHLRDGRPIRRLASYSPEQIEFRIKNYFKFMFVRHPLDRLVSAFKDRLKSKHQVPRRLYERYIIKKYRHAGEVYKDKGVQFSEFVRYLVDPSTRGYNAHWRPVSRLCLPCQIGYDFIGHYETLTADAAFVLDQLNLTARGIRYPSSDPDNRRHRYNTSLRMASMFANVDQSNIDVLKNVVYGNDFRLFGYT